MRKLLAAASLGLAALGAAADVVSFHTLLGREAPANTTGSGEVSLFFDTVTNDLRIVADWSGLLSPTTVAHIHCCLAAPGTDTLAPGFGGSPTVGVAVTPGTLPGFPVGVLSGHYDVTVDLDLAGSFTGGFVTNFGGGTLAGARDALLAGMSDGRAYFNIHTVASPGGEIRGFIHVPEPATWALAALAIGAAGLVRRRAPSAAAQPA